MPRKVRGDRRAVDVQPQHLDQDVERRRRGDRADLESATGEGYVAPRKDELKLIMAGRVLEDGQTVRGEPTTSSEDHERRTIPSKDR